MFSICHIAIYTRHQKFFPLSSKKLYVCRHRYMCEVLFGQNCSMNFCTKPFPRIDQWQWQLNKMRKHTQT